MSTTLHLSPSSAFCIKSSTLQPTSIKLQNEQIQVPKDLKVFLNIAWDPNVPPPPEASEQAIRNAIQGPEADGADAWFVPVVVSEGRMDTDKAGKPALVFDCVYNASLKTRSLADQQFKTFLVELALQRIEAQTSLMLSRQIGTPNIRSKGKLAPRTVHVSTELFGRLGADLPTSSPRSSTIPGISDSGSSPVLGKPLIEDITSQDKKKSPSSFDGKLKGILKSGSSTKNGTQEAKVSNNSPLAWTWSKENEQLRITVSVSNLTHDLVKSSMLDIEHRRLILNIPGRPSLDINLELPDAEIVAKTPPQSHGAMLATSQTPGQDSIQNNTLTLKRQRDFNVDGARAEWRVADKVLVVFA